MKSRSLLLQFATLATLFSYFATSDGLYVDSNDPTLTSLLASAYDYLIVGGGTTGLALASRLSESSSNSVLVLEAGSRDDTNPGIIVPGLAGSTLGTSVDWGFSTIPQTHANGRSVYWPRGKVLGGSSAINFMVWTRPQESEQDAWAVLANDSFWNWSSMLPFYKKSEQFTQPTGNSEYAPVAYTPSAHSTTGSVNISFPPYLAPQFDAYYSTINKDGIAVASDFDAGNNNGVGFVGSTIDPSSHSRSTSETAYITPNIARSNLVVVTNALVTRITWSSSTGGGLTVATGVTFQASGGSTVYTAIAGKEVIVSAGAVQTPQLLELSGIGNPSILSPLGIPTVVNLPGVGANLQDHPAVVNVYKLKPGIQSLDDLSWNATALAKALADYAQGEGVLTAALYPLAYLPTKKLLSRTDQTTALRLLATPNTGISMTQLAAQAALLAAGAPVVELLAVNVYFGASTGAPNTSYISLASCLQHSFSRGSIHITSNDPISPAAFIDPGYLSHPVDAFFLSKAAQFTRALARRPPLSNFIDVETEPGPSVQSSTDWNNWVVNSVRTEYHPIATAAMLPRSSGGVVASDLVVYGTQNLRVVDVSVVPLHVASHTVSVAYAIAEKAASIILGS